MIKGLPILLFTGLVHCCFTQKDSSNNLIFSTIGEFYYSYDFSEPTNHEKADYLYNHKRHNELNLNLGLIKASYNNERIRANGALMVGNYTQYNLASEPVWARFINEANFGFKLNKKRNLWLDAGIMPSHIGFESVISSDCWTVTRSLLAENSPFYETGIKITSTGKKEKLTCSFLLLNGWQKIQKPNNQSYPSAGLQLYYKPTKSTVFNYSNFIGSDKPDSLNSLRVFHNFYFTFNPERKFCFIFGFDIGTETDPANNIIHSWYSPVIIAKYNLNESLNINCRGEYYCDPDQVMITTGTENGFQTWGSSINMDYHFYDYFIYRLEAKYYNSRDVIFNYGKKENYTITSALLIKF